jgi:membrane protease YdiL (CAAX protease family)
MITARVPNFFHFLLFLSITLCAFLLSEGVVLGVSHGTPVMMALVNQKLQLTVNVLTYLVALAAAWFTFPLLWERTLSAGIRWNAAALQPGLALLGIAVGFISQGVTFFIPHPKDLPIEGFFHNPALIWFMVVFGVLIGPLFEEITFRGFLLPAVAIAVDWFRLPRDADPAVSLETLARWQASDAYTVPALIVSSIVTSLLFALIHAPQLGWTWSAVALLACVSLLFCAVRIRLRSVAASTLVHATYNLSVFVTLFVATGGFRHLDRV